MNFETTAEEEIQNQNQHQEEDTYEENDLFNIDDDDRIDQDEDDEFDTNSFQSDTTKENEDDDPEKEKEEEEDPEKEKDDALNFEEKEKEENKDFTQEDLEEFNKKMDTDFQTSKELKDFLNKTESKEDTPDEDKLLEETTQAIELYENIIGLDDEALMRKQFEQIAMDHKKDLNDEEVQAEINDKLEDLRDARQMDLRADKLRETLREKVINPNKAKKQEIEDARKQRQEKEIQTAKEEVTDALSEYFKKKDFYGLKPDKEKLGKAYQRVMKGDLTKELQSNKKLAAEVATFLEYKEELYKKATGASYSEGVKSVFEDHKSKNKNSADNALDRARRKGTSGGTDASGSVGLAKAISA